MQNKVVVSSLLLLQFLYCLHADAAISAGVLPYAFKNNILVILLGEESNGWSDFGGFPEGEESSLEAAVHEFSEETRYVFGKFALGLPLDKNFSLETLKQASRDYILPKLTMYVCHPRGTYRMYLAHVDYIPADEFNGAYKTPEYDKQAYIWVPVLELLSAVKQSDRKKAYYKGMKIRKEFVDELQSDAMQKAIQEIVKLKGG